MNIVVSNPKTSKAVSKKVEGVPAIFLNKRISETVSLDEIGLDGYTARITGGSDKDGFPMHPSLLGSMRKKILSQKGTGFRQDKKGEKRRKSVRGNTVTDAISQLNVSVVKEGKTPFSEFVAQTPKGIEQKKSIKEEMVEKSLAGVGDESVAAVAKEIKKSKK
ncbi:MAG: S6e family ribosomal protein [Candidatus Diapherotrites archaeon]|nr:S6e family ribosomal protein [Candidatus Diapherotrites archaeon]